MLEAARIQAGHRVLEIGSGGYNAALLAQLVGPTCHVTTLDIDPAVTDRALRFLPQAGYDHVSVVTADAEHLSAGVVPDGGFDAIVVTVDTWDLPWIDALAEGGSLVAPLRLHGYHWAIGHALGRRPGPDRRHRAARHGHGHTRRGLPAAGRQPAGSEASAAGRTRSGVTSA